MQKKTDGTDIVRFVNCSPIHRRGDFYCVINSKIITMSDQFAEVWSTISRIPALSLNTDLGIAVSNDCGSFFAAHSYEVNNFSMKSAKNLRKSTKSLDRNISINSTSLTLAVTSALNGVFTTYDVMTQNAAKVDSEVATALFAVASGTTKGKAELDQELAQHKAALDGEKAAVNKMKKDASKQWAGLQDTLKKLADTRQAIQAVDDDAKRVEKLRKKEYKLQNTIDTQKESIYETFLALENAVASCNDHRRRHLNVYCKEWVDRAKQLDVQRADDTVDAIRKWCSIQKETAQKLIDCASRVEEALAKVNAKVDVAQFATSAQLTKFESPPPDLTTELPCESSEVFKAVDMLVGSRAARISPSQSMSTQLETPSPVAKQALPKTTIEVAKPAPPKKRAPPPAPKAPRENCVKALYDYQESMGDEYMMFMTGDVVVVTDKTDANWWGGYKEKDPSKTELWFPCEFFGPI